MDAAQLDVTNRLTEKGALIEAVGEVDLTTARLLHEPLMKAVADYENTPVIVDLSRVIFIDSAGLALLVEARKRLAPEGRPLHILLAHGKQPERVLKLGRFDTIMALAYDLESLPKYQMAENSVVK